MVVHIAVEEGGNCRIQAEDVVGSRAVEAVVVCARSSANARSEDDRPPRQRMIESGRLGRQASSLLIDAFTGYSIVIDEGKPSSTPSRYLVKCPKTASFLHAASLPVPDESLNVLKALLRRIWIIALWRRMILMIRLSWEPRHLGLWRTSSVPLTATRCRYLEDARLQH